MSQTHLSDAFIFTPEQDWSSGHYPAWTSLFPLVRASPRALEIGSWEGRSAVFLLQNLCSKGGDVTCIDHFDLMNSEEGRERHRKLVHNLSLTGKRHRVLKSFSLPALYALLEEEIWKDDPGYDWVYIDGSHRSDDTLLDGELAWRLTRNGGIIVFDDYRWDAEPFDSKMHPKCGIDVFLQLHRGEYELLSGSESHQYQMILRKTCEMRIGFLLESNKHRTEDLKIQSRINIIFAMDSDYTMPAAIAIATIVQNTTRPITFLIGDYGISTIDRERLLQSVPYRDNVTINVIKMPTEGLVKQMGMVYAKIELMKIEYFDRAIYLDADILVRKDISALWDMDLEGYPIAAASDVGNPVGHAGVDVGKYFNAGVILMDLVKVREEWSSLHELAKRCSYQAFRDQDVLNVHFQDKWKEISLSWNAQGLGTYATFPAPGRELLKLEEMKDPSIVHFTGPLHPSVADVLNTWVQPYTAKPWGYAGAPGHPFSDEWWTEIKKTAWKDLKDSKEYKDDKNVEIQRALEKCRGEFLERLAAH